MRVDKFLMRGEGSIYVAAIVTIIIIGSAFLVGGVYPDLNQATTDGLKVYEPDDLRPDKKDTGVVQLRQLRVKKGKANRNNNNNNQNNNDDSNKDQSTPPVCENNGAIALLVNVSASMQIADKMIKLKNALQIFSNGLTSSTFVGLYTFASPSVGDPNVGEPEKEPKVRIPFGKFSKGAFDSAVDKLHPYLDPDGATNMRDGFVFVRNKLDQAKLQYPEKHFTLIVVSDGVPELEVRDLSHGPCPDTGRCYDYTQDPTVSTLPGGSIADAIKNSGISVYSIAIYDNAALEITNKLKKIMQNVASLPQNYHETLDGGELNSIFQQIEESVCK